MVIVVVTDAAMVIAVIEEIQIARILWLKTSEFVKAQMIVRNAACKTNSS